MEKYIGDYFTILYLEVEEAQEICRLGQGPVCCPYLVASDKGFECARMNTPISMTLSKRIEEGSMNAKGDECDWDETYKKAKLAKDSPFDNLIGEGEED